MHCTLVLLLLLWLGIDVDDEVKVHWKMAAEMDREERRRKGQVAKVSASSKQQQVKLRENPTIVAQKGRHTHLASAGDGLKHRRKRMAS